jgi:Zn finger protein HypA/HybF involved in hydrogenase expression
MTTAPFPARIDRMQTLCSRCKAVMTCEPGGECWCAGFAPVLPLPGSESDGCFCPKCLRDSIAAGVTRESTIDNIEMLPEGS